MEKRPFLHISRKKCVRPTNSMLCCMYCIKFQIPTRVQMCKYYKYHVLLTHFHLNVTTCSVFFRKGLLRN